MGGEKVRYPLLMMTGAGSPPRGRGKVVADGLIYSPDRITPAWAGKSQKHNCNLCRLEDHPRVGGEKTKKIP